MTSELRVDRIVPTTGVPTGGGGGVIQVVSTTKTDTFSMNSETPTLITGLTSAITPTRSDSKILVSVDINSTSDNGNYTTWIYIYRDGSVVSGATGDQGESNQARAFKMQRYKEANWMANISGIYLDSPSTTSATTYQIYMSQESGSIGYINRTHSNNNSSYHPRSVSSITLMEVSG